MNMVYNITSDDWESCHEDENDAVQEWLSTCGLSDHQLLNLKSITLYKGVPNKINFKEFLFVDSIVDDMQNTAYDNYDELAEDYLDDVTVGMKKELEDLIIGWANKHNLQPDFYDVDNIKSYEYFLTKEDKDVYL